MDENALRINSVIDAAMKIRRDRGNAELSDSAKAEIRSWLQANQDIVSRKVADNWTDEDFATALAGIVGRAHRIQDSGIGDPIGGDSMKMALGQIGDSNQC
jgi:hypothetical protein